MGILRIIGGVSLGLFILFIIGIQIWDYFDKEKRNDYCSGLYPPKINELSIFDDSWSEYRGVEDGYIRCCRNYYENHEKKKECKMFPYLKEVIK